MWRKDLVAKSNVIKERGLRILKSGEQATFYHFLVGPVVRICRSHRQGPGSIPGLGTFFALLIKNRFRCSSTFWQTFFIQIIAGRKIVIFST